MGNLSARPSAAGPWSYSCVTVTELIVVHEMRRLSGVCDASTACPTTADGKPGQCDLGPCSFSVGPRPLARVRVALRTFHVKLQRALTSCMGCRRCRGCIAYAARAMAGRWLPELPGGTHAPTLTPCVNHRRGEGGRNGRRPATRPLSGRAQSAASLAPRVDRASWVAHVVYGMSALEWAQGACKASNGPMGGASTASIRPVGSNRFGERWMWTLCVPGAGGLPDRAEVTVCRVVGIRGTDLVGRWERRFGAHLQLGNGGEGGGGAHT